MENLQSPPSAGGPPPPRRSDGSVSNTPAKEEEDTPMIGGEGSYSNSRTLSADFQKMCKRVGSSGIESLPNELLFNILVHLPADDVGKRARLVSRRWSHIIRFKDFINKHFERSTYGLVLSPIPQSQSILVTARQGRVETSALNLECRSLFWTSCNGLVLDYNKGPTGVHVVNPATEQSLLLPSFPTQAVCFGQTGIAYAVASMVYKVTLKPHNSGLRILTVGVDKHWRYVEVRHLPFHLQSQSHYQWRPLATEGFIHWKYENKRGDEVLSLNVETEIITCSQAPLPESYKDKHYLSTGKNLSLLFAHGNFLWDVWVMEPETGEWREVRHDIKFRLERENEDMLPVGWVKYPEVLALCPSSKSRLCSSICIFYNLDTHEIDSIDLPFPVQGYKAFVHRNSLLWI